MNDNRIELDEIDVAAPCPANWADMSGDDKVRFCGQCKLNVYNLSNMTRDEATELVLVREGKLCVRFRRRADGTVLTADCPVGLGLIGRQVRRGYARVVALCGVLFTGLFGCARTPAVPMMGEPALIPTSVGTPAPVPVGRELQGEVCLPEIAAPVPKTQK